MNEPTPGTRQSPARPGAERIEPLRLLPWAGAGGIPCYLSAAEAADGYVSRVADRIEAEQMELAGELLDDARALLAARSWTQGELHLLAVQLTESLTLVHRIAQSRGTRLPEAASPDGDVS